MHRDLIPGSSRCLLKLLISWCFEFEKYNRSYCHSQAFINVTGGRRNRTALHYASIANNVAIVKVLLKFNADQEIVDATGYTALNLSNGGEVCRLLHKVSDIIGSKFCSLIDIL